MDFQELKFMDRAKYRSISAHFPAIAVYGSYLIVADK
jgi:hypothetical protein